MEQKIFAVLLTSACTTLGMSSIAKKQKKKNNFIKFTYYCENNVGNLEGSISSAKTKLENLGTICKELVAKKAQTGQALKDHQGSGADAKQAMAEATPLRKKEAAAYAKVKADSDANLAALTKAITALWSYFRPPQQHVSWLSPTRAALWGRCPWALGMAWHDDRQSHPRDAPPQTRRLCRGSRTRTASLGSLAHNRSCERRWL